MDLFYQFPAAFYHWLTERCQSAERELLTHFFAGFTVALQWSLHATPATLRVGTSWFLHPTMGPMINHRFKSPLGHSKNAPFQHRGGQKFVIQFFKKTVLLLARLVPLRLVPPPSSHTHLRPMKQTHTVSTGTWYGVKIPQPYILLCDFRRKTGFLRSNFCPFLSKFGT